MPLTWQRPECCTCRVQEGKSPETAGQALDLLGSMFPFLASLGKQMPASGPDSSMKLDALSASVDCQRVRVEAFKSDADTSLLHNIIALPWTTP